MGYLIGQILVCLLIAAVIGFIAGWLVRGLSYRQRGAEQTGARGDETVQQPAAIPQEAVAGTKSHHSDYRIEEIEGIGKGFGRTLREKGIGTTSELLEKCSIPEGRREIAAALKLDESVISKWVSMADLMRISGMGGQFAELMEASGIRSVAHLSKEDPGILAARMEEVNEREHRTRVTPSEEMVREWIDKAGSLPDGGIEQ